jgi:hypothetical protein
VVTGYAPGKGKHKGSTGALKCKMESGKVVVDRDLPSHRH